MNFREKLALAHWTQSRYRDCLPDSSLLGDTESG